MKQFFLTYIIFGFLLFFSCDDGFEEINENPLAPTEVNYEAIFNELVNSLRLDWNQQLFLHNEILYDVTELGVVTAKTFGNVDSGTEEIWSNYYSALKNARQLEENIDELVGADLEATLIVKAQIDILMAYKTFKLLDLFGSIPYSEAGRAYGDQAIVRPKYDDERDIYLSLLTDLREASDLLIITSGNTAAGNPFLRVGSHDALFGDNLGQWIKFSNSMLLKYLVRIADKEPELVNEEVANILTNGYDLINPGEDVMMSPSQQGWSNLGVNWSFREHNKLRMGSNLWTLLTEDDEILDPRANIFFETNNTDEWVAFPQLPNSGIPQSGGAPYDKDIRDNAYDNKGDGNIYSSFNFYLVRDEQDIPEILLTAAEMKFILAEVFLKGIGTGQDQSIASFRYAEGMLTSMEFWQDLVQNSSIWENKPTPLSTGELYQLTENPKYKFVVGASEEENLSKIYTQRWINYFRQPWEAFTMIRQTNLIPREKPTNDFFRFQYPVSESAYNFDNWSEQVGRMGGDETDVRLWWME